MPRFNRFEENCKHAALHAAPLLPNALVRGCEFGLIFAARAQHDMWVVGDGASYGYGNAQPTLHLSERELHGAAASGDLAEVERLPRVRADAHHRGEY